jgi:hypothetical protein
MERSFPENIKKREINTTKVKKITEVKVDKKNIMKNKKYFFGWENIKWFIREFGKIYTDNEHYFSKKRIESSIAFLVGQWGMIYFLVYNIDKLNASDIVLWSAIQFTIAGYMVNQIQKEKKEHYDDYHNDNEN